MSELIEHNWESRGEEGSSLLQRHLDHLTKEEIKTSAAFGLNAIFNELGKCKMAKQKIGLKV